MKEAFSNNAEGILSAPISDTDTAITLVDSPGAYKFADVGGGSPGRFQRATLTNPDDPDDVEIVHITNSASGLQFGVLRQMEGTSAKAWGAGTKLSARVTADMLASFLSYSPGEGIKTPGSSFLVNGRADTNGSVVQISGWPVLQLARAEPQENPESQDINLSHEAVGGTPIMSLGVTPAWVSNANYTGGAVVNPTTPNGYQYSFEPEPAYGATQEMAEPEFDVYGYPLEVVGSESDLKGYWVPVPDPVDLAVSFSGFPGKVMLTEVGFVCTEYEGATPPTISITADAEGSPTPLVAGVALSQITGGDQCQRFQVAGGGALSTGVRFKVDTAGTGTFKGKFYWRGIAFKTYW